MLYIFFTRSVLGTVVLVIRARVFTWVSLRISYSFSSYPSILRNFLEPFLKLDKNSAISAPLTFSPVHLPPPLPSLPCVNKYGEGGGEAEGIWLCGEHLRE